MLARYAVDETEYPPVVCAVLLTCVSTFLVIEQTMLKMSTGHAETVAFVEDIIRRLEGDRLPVADIASVFPINPERQR